MNNAQGAPSFKSLDGKMQKGYELLEKQDLAGACQIWLETWNDFLRLYEESRAKSIKEFDRQFNGTQWVSNWVQDLEVELWNAGLDNPRFLTNRISFCEEMLGRFGGDGEDLRNENSRRALAECYSRFGQPEKVDALYNEWLDSDPRWGWGWIGWATCYFLAPEASKDADKSERLLRQGLSIADVRDRDDILERLADTLDDLGKSREADEFRQQIDRKHKPMSVYLGDGSVPAG